MIMQTSQMMVEIFVDIAASHRRTNLCVPTVSVGSRWIHTSMVYLRSSILNYLMITWNHSKKDRISPSAILLEYLPNARSFESAGVSLELIETAIEGLKEIHGACVIQNDAYPKNVLIVPQNKSRRLGRLRCFNSVSSRDSRATQPG